MKRNETFNKERKNYYRQIRRRLVCSSQYKHRFLRELDDSIQEYCVRNHPESFSVILAEFGTPEDIAAACLSAADPNEIRKKMSCCRAILVSAAVLAGTVIGITSFLYASACIRGSDSVVTHKTIIIQYDNTGS